MARTRVGLYTPGFIVIGGNTNPNLILSPQWPAELYSSGGPDLPLLGPYASHQDNAIGALVPLWFPSAPGSPAANEMLARGDKTGRQSVLGYSYMSEHTATLTRSAVTTAYATGQVIGTTGAAAIALADAGPDFAGNDTVTDFYFRNRMISTLTVAIQSAAAFDLDVLLFRSAPSYIGGVDYATFAPSMADSQLLIGVASYAAADAVAWGANQFLYTSQNLGWIINESSVNSAQISATTAIWFSAVARSAWTPPANSSTLLIGVNSFS